MLRTARLGAKPLATSKSPRESGLWSSIALRLDRDFENGRPRKAKDRFPAINHDAVPVGGYEASLFIHIIQRCDADDEAVGASQQLAGLHEHIRFLPFQSAVRQIGRATGRERVGENVYITG